MSNSSLNSAKEAKQNEFYTLLPDIENELRHYSEHFKGKTVLCNCDDPRVSNFFKYFALKFKALGLKKLIATCYKNQDYDLFTSNCSEHAVYIVYEGTPEIDHIPSADELEVKYLNGDGDFNSPECLALMDEADIVCTNPPFSLLRDFLNLLVRKDKKFLIIGNTNALHYADVFPLIKNNKIWIGYNHVKAFQIPQTEIDNPKIQFKKDGKVYQKFGNVGWFTNLEIPKHYQDIILFKKYTPEDYPTYENFDAIDVSNVADIPCDYYGIMGVPDGFLEQFNPNQFELISVGSGNLAKLAGVKKNYRGRTDLALVDKNGNHSCPYSRILIRRKQ